MDTRTDIRLTKRQREVLRAIEWLTDFAGVAPTLEELADHLGGISIATVHEHIGKLKALEIVDSVPGRPRTLRIKHKVCPKCGSVAAA